MTDRKGRGLLTLNGGSEGWHDVWDDVGDETQETAGGWGDSRANSGRGHGLLLATDELALGLLAGGGDAAVASGLENLDRWEGKSGRSEGEGGKELELHFEGWE